jgi:thiol-disulfide isomerase/thioredoxin
MQLETMEPNPVWVADAYGETIDTLAAHADDLVFKVWGGDWCKDCRAQLPDFAAALDAAGVPESHIEHYPVDEDKQGPGVEGYGIEYIPTVVVERVSESDSGEEVARYVEEESVPIAVYLADRLEERDLAAEESTAEP